MYQEAETKSWKKYVFQKDISNFTAKVVDVNEISETDHWISQTD